MAVVGRQATKAQAGLVSLDFSLFGYFQRVVYLRLAERANDRLIESFSGSGDLPNTLDPSGEAGSSSGVSVAPTVVNDVAPAFTGIEAKQSSFAGGSMSVSDHSALNPRAFSTSTISRLLKPSPLDIQELYLGSLREMGIDPLVHDIRFVEDNWESPTLGAWGLGWEVWLNGMEVTQFTYFQQVGGLECRPVTGEITYGLERLAMYLQNVESIYDIVWTDGPLGRISYGDVYHQNELEQSKYNFEEADVDIDTIQDLAALT